MARIRTIKPEFWDEDEVTPFLSPLAALTFVGLISVADDEGRGKAGEAALFKRLHGGRPKTTRKAFQAALKELADSGIAVFYTVDGKDYYELPNFRRHQKIDRPNPSLIPTRENKQEIKDRRGLVEDSSSDRRVLIEQSPPEGKGGEGRGREGNGTEGKGGEAAAPPARPLAEASPNGRTVSEQTHPGGVADLLAQSYQAMNPGLISRAKAHRHIEAAIAVGVDPKAIESAVMCPEAKGKKLWEILDPLRPTAKDLEVRDRRDAHGPRKL